MAPLFHRSSPDRWSSPCSRPAFYYGLEILPIMSQLVVQASQPALSAWQAGCLRHKLRRHHPWYPAERLRGRAQKGPRIPLRKPEYPLESTGWRAHGPESESVVSGALFTIRSHRFVIPSLIRCLAPGLAQLSRLAAVKTKQEHDSDTHRAKAGMSHEIIRITRNWGYIESQNVL